MRDKGCPCLIAEIDGSVQGLCFSRPELNSLFSACFNTDFLPAVSFLIICALLFLISMPLPMIVGSEDYVFGLFRRSWG